jgi:hypothetical protein
MKTYWGVEVWLHTFLTSALRRRDSSVGIVTRLRAGRSGFDFRQGLGILLFSTAFRPALEPTQPPIQWVPGVNRPGREADHSPPCSAEVKNV